MYKRIIYCLIACLLSSTLISWSWMYTKQQIKTHPRSTIVPNPNIKQKGQLDEKEIHIKHPKIKKQKDQPDKTKPVPKNDIPGYKKDLTKDDIECLAVTVYYEALHEPQDGKRAVVYAVLNRASATKYKYVKNGKKKSSIYAIITAPKQFSWVHGNYKRAKRLASETDTEPGWQQWIPLVLKVVNNYHIKNSPIKDATHFVNIDEATEDYKWWTSHKMKVVKKIGSHTFLKNRDAEVIMPGKKTQA